MATFYSTEITAKDASSGEKYNNLDHLKTATFNYTTVGTEAAADVVELVELPANSTVIGFSMQWTDLGTATGDVGVTSGGQELAAGLALGTADDNYVNFVEPVSAALNKVYLEVLTATLDAAGTISGVVFYI